MLLFATLAACASKPEPGDSASDPEPHDSAPVDSHPGHDSAEPEPDDTGVDDPSDQLLAFYDQAAIHVVKLTLPQSSIDALAVDPSSYAPADVELDGDRLEGVAVKVQSGDVYGKPRLKLDLDPDEDGQDYGGLEHLVLDPMANDPAMARAVVAAQLWRDAGVPAPLAAYADLWVNGDSWGLYASIEAVDHHWVGRHWAGDEGPLWEGKSGCDFTTEGLPAFELQTDADDDALTAVAGILADGGDDVWSRVDEWVDTDALVAYWAWTVTTGNGATYPYALDDVWLYGDPSDRRIDFVPADGTGAWDPALDPRTVDGALGQACLQDTDCHARLGAAVDAALTTFEADDVDTLLSRTFERSTDAVAQDPRMAWTPDDVELARQELAAQVAAWPEQVRAAFDR